MSLEATLAGIIGVIALVAGAFMRGRSKGRDAEQQRQLAQSVKVAKAQQQARQEVARDVQKLPEAPQQVVDDADPGTAAGKLRDRWSRD